MKKVISVILIVITACLAASCGCSAQPSAELNRTPEKELSQADSIVVYFSMPVKTNVNNTNNEPDKSMVTIDGVNMGCTQYVAHIIREATSSDIFRIVSTVPYPTDHQTFTGYTKKEKTDDVRPPIQDSIDNMDQYSTVYVGFPIWWEDMPMIMYTFFDQYDLSGKTIIPFCVESGTGPCGVVDTIKELEPDATVVDDILSVSIDDGSECEPQVKEWVESVGDASSDAE